MKLLLVTRKFALLSLVATLFVGLFVPNTEASAKNLDTTGLITEQQVKEILGMTDVRWEKTTVDNGETEYTLSDEKFKEYLTDTNQKDLMKKMENEQKKLAKEENTKDSISISSSGVTKLVKLNINGKTYYDLYLSKLVAQCLVVGGTAAVGTLIALIPGIGWTVAGSIIGSVGGFLTSTLIANGVIIRFNSWWVPLSARKQ